MKTYKKTEIMAALEKMGAAEVLEKLQENWSGYYDAICYWDGEGLQFAGKPARNSFPYEWYENNIILIELDAAGFQYDAVDWNELFSDEELDYMEDNELSPWDFLESEKNKTSHGADWEFSGKSMAEREADASEFYFDLNWDETLENAARAIDAWTEGEA